MKCRKVLMSLMLLFVVLASYAQYVVSGGAGKPLRVEQTSGDSAERLEIYLVYGTDNVTISYSSSSSNHVWYRYKNRRIEAERIASTQNGNSSTVAGLSDGYGYFVDEGAVSRYVWIIDYSKYVSTISSLRVASGGEPCGGLRLDGDGDIRPIYYYWPNSGARRELRRRFDVMYNTLEYDPVERRYSPKQESVQIQGNLFGSSIPAPLCDTEICVKGDYFARHFGKETTRCVDMYQAIAVEARIDTLVIEEEARNINTAKSGFCAPVTIEFTAVANQPTAALFNWIIYREGEEEDPIVRFTGEAMDYTFSDAGSFVVKLEVSDQTTTCGVEDEIRIDISESYLKIPNAFSPGTTPGINDEFKVAYKSLVTFKAWIFNRWGLQLYHWTDPSQGWDGKKAGRYVQPGVYFYVIEAEGSDGIKYKRKGDINILRPKTVEEENESIKE